MLAYTGRLRPKGIPFSVLRHMKGWGFYSLKCMKGWGNLSFGSVKGPKVLIDAYSSNRIFESYIYIYIYIYIFNSRQIKNSWKIPPYNTVE